LAPQINSEFYLVHFLYKLFNKDQQVLKDLVKVNPFEWKEPLYLKVDLYHYWLTDYQSQKVTFGMRNFGFLMDKET